MKAKSRKLLDSTQAKWRHIKPIVLGVIVAFVLAGFCFATVISTPPTKQAISGIWFGFTSNANDFYRLVLNDQSGMLSARFANSAVRVYKIDSWTLDSKGRMQFSISAVSSNAYTINVTGKVTTPKLQLRIEPPDKGWTQDVVAYREELIEGQIKTLRKAME